MFHLHVKYRSRDSGGSCEKACLYIAREGRFRSRPDKLRWVESLHMPAWAKGGSSANYWRHAEGALSRVNARTAMLIEFALPKALSIDGQNSLALEMAQTLSSMASEDGLSKARLPITIAVHEGKGQTPHAHVLVSTSMNDNIVRDEQLWFRRYAPKSPIEGGARRSEYVTKKRWLYRVREVWATLANAALKRVGLPTILDHRSFVARGEAVESTIHLGPRIASMLSLGIDTTRGARQAAIEKANEDYLALLGRMLTRRSNLVVMEQEAAIHERDHRIAETMRDEMWQSVLRQHPLTGYAGKLSSAATALVIESDKSNLARLHVAFPAHRDMEIFAAAVGSAWEVFPTSDGLWAIKPDHPSVVMLGAGYAATDGEDEESLTALMASAKTLSFLTPVLRVGHAIEGMAVELLDRLGLDWKITIRKAPRRSIRAAR